MKTLLQTGLIAALCLSGHARGDEKPAAENKADANPAEKAEPLDVKGQLYARYVAGGQQDERDGLSGPCSNYPKSLAAGEKFGEPGKLSITVAANEPVDLGKLAAIRLRIVNRSDKQEYFSAIDSHLYIVQEARNEKGEWQAIERIPHGSGPRNCAVGFHRISLKPGEYWNLVGVRYAGPLKTKLRFRLDLGKNGGRFPQPGGKRIYSEEFDGSINPGQFQSGPATGRDLKPL